MSTIKFVDQISDLIEAKMQKGYIKYENSHGIDVNYKKFALVLSDENEDVVGVLSAYTAFAEIYIDDLWVDEAHRGKGYGRRLLKELENHFKGKGFNNINLVTSQFQAPEFYKKCGFKAEFIRQNLKNPKLTKTFFIKYFDDEIQNQGIITKDHVVCMNNEVHRPVGPWTKHVHKLLRYLREQGFYSAPKPLGFDKQGREIVSFLKGGTSHCPFINSLCNSFYIFR